MKTRLFGILYRNLVAKNRIRLSDQLILDVGCGNGRIDQAFADGRNRVIGVDLENENEQVLCDATHLPFKNHVFDTILEISVIQYLHQQETFVKELDFILKKKGKIIIQTPNRLFPIDPHYLLPLLYFLPRKWAKFYMKFAKKQEYNLYPLSKCDIYKLFKTFNFLISESYWYPIWMIPNEFSFLYIILRKIMGHFLSPSLFFVLEKRDRLRARED